VSEPEGRTPSGQQASRKRLNWAGLVDAAVLGTGRAQVPAAAGTCAALATAGLEDTDDQTRLLHQAAALSRARRAGFRPPARSDRSAPAPAADDGRPPVSLNAERRLAGLLAAGQYELAAEWLGHLDGRRPPDVLLPDLLTAAASRPRLRARLLPALGPLAGWLAGFNDEWAWARAAGPLPAGPALIWETGGGEDRRALLGMLRAADPAAGRNLVASTWETDSYRDRAAFVAMLTTGLSLDDEPLAERALADRRAEVRRAGAELLAALPGSRYSRRAAARAAAAVRVERAGLRTRIAVTIMEVVTAEMLADGIEGPRSGGMRERGELLRQLVAAAPAGMWAGHTGLDPAGLLALAHRTDWPNALRDGWTVAAIRDRDPEWVIGLLGHASAGGADPGGQPPGTPRRAAGRPTDHDLRLLAALPLAARQEWLAANPDSPLFWAALDQLPAPWSVRLSDQVRASLASLAAVARGHALGARAAVRLAASRLEPPIAPQLSTAEVADGLATAWDDMLAALTIRAAIRRELAEEPSP